MPERAHTLAGALGVALLCFSVVACEGPGMGSEKKENKSFTYSGEKLTISAGNSDVRLRAGDSGRTVRAVRTLKGKAGEDGNATWELAGSTLRLRTECNGVSVSCAARYTITVPENLPVELRSTNGAISSVGLPQSQDITSSNATVRVEKASGTVRLHVRDGNTEATGISAGSFSADTRNGRLKVVFDKAPRKVKATTTNGNLNVTLPAGDEPYRTRVKAENGQANSSVRNTSGAERSLDVLSRNGSVRVDRAK